MKKLFLILFLSVSIASYSQDYIDINSPIPVSKDVIIGKLDNGLTYYIRKNGIPENKVELRLVVNAGSILETDAQRGLAHFMEHMNFNGTKNFQHNDLVDYLQSIGVKFGQHLNAYTSFDETVYILPIPSDDAEKLDKGFDILEDWAFNCLLAPEEIDKERGVVLEELRLGLGADQRMLMNYLPKMMYNSQYANRLPIGTKEVLENFKHQELIDFYKSWYRPNLMAVVVVGDIDVAEMEQKIKDHFGSYQNPKDEKKRTEFYVPDHEETFIAIEKDKEASFTQVQLVYNKKGNTKRPAYVSDYRKMIMTELFNSMINNRLQEIANNPNPPFNYGYSYYGSSWSRNKSAYQSMSMSDPQNQLRAFETLVVENERVLRYGFTQGELDRVKADILSQYEAMVANKNKTESRRLVGELVNNFLEGEVIPGIESEYKAHKILFEGIGLLDVNELIAEFIHDDNRVIVFTGPDGENLPVVTEKDILDVLANVKTMDLDPYDDGVVAESLITTMPVAGKVTSTSKNEKLGLNKIVLSNGVTVYYKKTDFNDNEILMQAYSPGGSSQIKSAAEYNKTKLAMGGLQEAGLNGFTTNDLTKMMSGKEASVNAFVYDNYEGMRGKSVNKDIETMFELIYLNFTALNKNKEAYQSYADKQTAFLGNLLNTPQYWYMNEKAKVTQKNNPRFTNAIPTAEEFAGQDYDLAYNFYQNRFADASDFTFIFIGSLDEEKIVELSKKYLGSLPSIKRKEAFIDYPYERLTGEQEFVFHRGEDPKSSVEISFRTEAEYDANQAYYLECAGEILTIKLVENLREGESGVYGVGARGFASKWPTGVYNFSISFPCGPENVEKLKAAALAELNKLLLNGPEEKDLIKIKEAQRLELKEKMKQNNFWLSNLSTMLYYNIDFNEILKAEADIEALTAKDIQDAANKYIAKNRIITVLLPEEK